MSAYLWTDEIPFILQFTDLEPLTVRVSVAKWMKEHRVLQLNPTGGNDEALEEDIAGLLINFGAIRMVWVKAERPDTDKYVVDLGETDLEAL
jgi:hypothetical protein